MSKFEIDASEDTFEFGIKLSTGIQTFVANYPTTTGIIQLKKVAEEAEKQDDEEVQVNQILEELAKVMKDGPAFLKAATEMHARGLADLVKALIGELGGKR